MTNKRKFSLLSLLVLISFVALLLALFLARRELLFQSARYDQLHQKYETLFEKTGQIEATDPDLVYVRHLESGAPFVFRYRIAVPQDLVASLGIEKNNNSAANFETSFQSELGPTVETDDSHDQFELTIRIGKIPEKWSVNVECSGPTNTTRSFRLILDQKSGDWLKRVYAADRDPFSLPGGPARTQVSPVRTFTKSKPIVLQEIAEKNQLGEPTQRNLRFGLLFRNKVKMPSSLPN